MTENNFANKFLDVFAKDITEKQLKACGLSKKRKSYLWNLFGYKLVPSLEGMSAREEYNRVDKTDAFEVLYDSPNILAKFETESLDPLHTTAEGIDEAGLLEFYIIGKDFSWCYVVTHAGDGAGPYFCYAPKN